jgi:hypothetical protein
VMQCKDHLRSMPRLSEAAAFSSYQVIRSLDGRTGSQAVFVTYQVRNRDIVVKHTIPCVDNHLQKGGRNNMLAIESHTQIMESI